MITKALLQKATQELQITVLKKPLQSTISLNICPPITI